MMKHFILFCLIFIFVSACSIFRGTDVSETPAEDFLSEEEKKDSSDADSSEPEEMSKVDEEDIEYIDPEDEDLIDEDIVVDEDLPSDDIDPVLKSDEKEQIADEFDGLEDVKDTEYIASSPPPTSSSPVAVQQKKWISLKKIKLQAYTKGGFLVNAVYIAREGDTVESVAQKIFSSDESAQLYAINSYLKNRRRLKIGDKIYYQSPRRSQDDSRILFYFEDIQAEPKYYRIEKGQNIRKVASELLGSLGGSWKEIWATNPQLVSKGVVDESVEIKYWTEISAPIPPTADNANMVAEESSTDESAPNNEEDVSPAPPEIEESSPELPSPVAEEIESTANLNKMVKKIFNFSIDNIILITLAAISLIMAFVLSKRRRKKAEYDFTAANFEIEDEDK